MTALRPTLAVAGGLLLAPFVLAQSPLPPVDPFGPAPSLSKPTAAPAPALARTDTVKQAVDAFQRAKDGEPAKFAAARDLFAQAAKEKPLTDDQQAAWAYARVRCATDRLNGSTDAATAAEVVAEVEDALAAVPNHAGLRTAANDILAAARKRSGSATRRPIAETPPTPRSLDANAVDSKSFVVKFQGRKAVAEDLIQAAEKARADVFKRWSGPAGGDWAPKCEIVLHPTAEAFAAATALPAAATGRAEVKLSSGQVASRRIDLRADDETLIETALPREITHVVLADLYPGKQPPAWAALAMGVLSTNEEEIGRYLRTAQRCARDGELPSAAAVLNAEGVPAKDVTGFHAESVAVADYLVRWKGEKMFTAFVRDSLRYGSADALRRQYGLSDVRELETAMRKR